MVPPSLTKPYHLVSKVQDVRYCIPAGDPNFKLETTWCPSNAEGKNSGVLSPYVMD
ncbi:MAG: hypothetical protein IPL23_10855 [Saprospiraceae bacterium]|nr:hypothetical protein [Saprospiraceae bacterium]